MNGRLNGQVALITGGGAGIGAATAKLFCQEGAKVLVVDASEKALEETLTAVRAENPEAQISSYLADVTSAEKAVDAVGVCVTKNGALNILVNNAAMRNYSAAANATPAEWQSIVNVNLIGMSNYCKAALPAMRLSGSGSIVNVSSCYAVTGRKGMALYDATKAAQLAYTRALAFEESENGVRVNAICPGSTLTEFHVGRAKTVGKSVETLKSERKETSLIGRWAAAEEIAWPIVWLASREASFITGTTLMVDGGLHIM
jgi:meso-butanediol dehydrogenase/(S,S)-butanediol dehydrogenase/diacetyl reductase